MNIKVLQELQEISPELADLKKHHSPVDMPIGYQKELFEKIKSDLPQNPKSKRFNLPILGAVAAACIVMIAYVSLLKPAPQVDVQKEVYESYVLENLEEYEDILVDDQEVESWLTRQLDDIPESELISYLENNLDQLDLNFQY